MSAGLAEWVVLVAENSVWPSAGARATATAAIVPFAPARFSTRTVAPIASASSGATMRPTPSVPEPAAKGTTSVTGRPGRQGTCPIAVQGSRTGAVSSARR